MPEFKSTSRKGRAQAGTVIVVFILSLAYLAVEMVHIAVGFHPERVVNVDEFIDGHAVPLDHNRSYPNERETPEEETHVLFP
jgi:hypothetical protein